MTGQSTENDRSRALHDAYIWRVYNTPELHGSYCPCEECESISGPLPGWVHEIGQRATRPIIPPAEEPVGGRVHVPESLTAWFWTARRFICALRWHGDKRRHTRWCGHALPPERNVS